MQPISWQTLSEGDPFVQSRTLGLPLGALLRELFLALPQGADEPGREGDERSTVLGGEGPNIVEPPAALRTLPAFAAAELRRVR